MAAVKMRYYYMDAMRSILMMLGIFIHSAQVFNPNQNWLVYSDQTNPLFSYIVTFIHSFRMPAFFIISGFFCLMMLQRQPVNTFIKSKFQRIFLPLLVTILTLNLLQSVILCKISNQAFSFNIFFISGDWLSHLWFLINLLVYFTVAAFITLFFTNPIRKISNLIKPIEKLPIEVLILLLPLFSIAILGLNKIGFPLYSTFFYALDTYQIISYIPYFIFGILLFNFQDLLKKFSSIHFISLFGLMSAAYLLHLNAHFDSEILHYFSKIYSQSLIAWVSSALIFKIFYLFTNKQSKIWLFLSNSAYSVYLFHNLTVVLLAIILVKYSLHPFMSFLILVLATTTITLLIHKRIILKFKLMQLFFNGKN